jgi:membrane protease YdiL (CAAX protease family)
MIRTLLDEMAKTRHVLISIFIYMLFMQFLHATIPVIYLKEYLVSGTIVCLPMLLAINYISLIHKPETTNILRYNKVILYTIAGILVCVAINYPYNVINKIHAKPSEYSVFINYGITSRLYFILLLGAIGPVIEEIYFRLYVYTVIKEEYGIGIGIFVSSFIFMVFHGFKVDILYLFIPGVIYALAYEKTKTIWSSIVVHGFNNLIWFSLVYYS